MGVAAGVAGQQESMNTFKSIGNGPHKVLMLPGLLGDQRAFDAALAYADLDTFQYAVMDYRGFGQSRSLEGLHTVHEASMDATYLAEYLRWDEFSVVGHSVGGLVAQMLALAKPRSVRRVVTIAGAPASGIGRNPARRQLLNAAADSLDARLTLVNAGTGEKLSRAACMHIAAATLAETRPEAFRRLAESAQDTDISAQIKGSSLPLTVIVGASDPRASVQLAQTTTLAWYPNSTLVVIEGGHYLANEAPALLMTCVERALA